MGAETEITTTTKSSKINAATNKANGRGISLNFITNLEQSNTSGGITINALEERQIPGFPVENNHKLDTQMLANDLEFDIHPKDNFIPSNNFKLPTLFHDKAEIANPQPPNQMRQSNSSTSTGATGISNNAQLSSPDYSNIKTVFPEQYSSVPKPVLNLETLARNHAYPISAISCNTTNSSSSSSSSSSDNTTSNSGDISNGTSNNSASASVNHNQGVQNSIASPGDKTPSLVPDLSDYLNNINDTSERIRKQAVHLWLYQAIRSTPIVKVNDFTKNLTKGAPIDKTLFNCYGRMREEEMPYAFLHYIDYIQKNASNNAPQYVTIKQLVDETIGPKASKNCYISKKLIFKALQDYIEINNLSDQITDWRKCEDELIINKANRYEDLLNHIPDLNTRLELQNQFNYLQTKIAIQILAPKKYKAASGIRTLMFETLFPKMNELFYEIYEITPPNS